MKLSAASEIAHLEERPRAERGAAGRFKHRLSEVGGGASQAAMRAAAALAATSPDRTALSIKSGRPFCTYEPARKRLRQAVVQAGRSASCAGVAAKPARFCRIIRQAGVASERPVRVAAAARQ